ncbi:integrin beta-PS-like [Belonocnema kinseyi]|uniref:integrin beta-PS-like n=1 Tax=Belonocnema kinseyi TaxID=2817044 RepID=UPI00143D64CE|nr:integrin beta-PS-like [Belonocnema kinseyi]
MFGPTWRFIIPSVLCWMYVQANSPGGTNNCISRQTCHECIQTEFCGWCMKPDLNEPRCFYAPGTDVSKFCSKQDVFYPDNEFSIVQSQSLSSESEYWQSTITETESQSSRFNATCCGAGKNDPVQIAPQEVNIKVRINQAQKVRFAFSQAEDYPVDLYYLMDLSKSMEDDKEKLSDLGDTLVREMSSLTSNFRLGFGSFVDKVVMPYVSVVPQKLIEPCNKCAAPYGYKHIMSLSEDASSFSKLVRGASVSGNLDAPEGGFDAIMQAIVCTKQIGWREKARRLLVFSTDASFHFAGDGKLGGIVKPNDGMCHLDRYSGMYTHSSVQDYPSIFQINQKVQQNAINIIWAVTKREMSTYSSLCSHIQGSSAGLLSNDSSNIVELIKEQYNQIRSTVEIKDTANSAAIKIKYWSKCLDKNGQIVQTTKCDKLQKGDKVEFVAEITATHCPANKSEWNQKFTIYPVGINESLVVNLEMICDCGCEQSEHPSYEIDSPKCGYSGIYKCGICECYPGFFGKKCECNNEFQDPIASIQSCRRYNTSSIECSGRGECVCGKCECNQPGEGLHITGPFCECDNFSCDRRDNKICSDHGECNCGECKCSPDWQGPACECPKSTDTCTQPGTKIPCSGHGTCECGQCVCREENGIKYTGSYCQKCPDCPKRCEELTPCVMCQIHKFRNMTDEECAANCSEIPIERVETIDKTSFWEDEVICDYKDENDCTYTFVYFYNETKLVVQAQERPDCPPEIYLLGVILAVVAGVVLTGVAALVAWKTFATIKDKQECARFEKERMMAKWDAGENPIYKQATSTFKNPTYAGR